MKCQLASMPASASCFSSSAATRFSARSGTPAATSAAQVAASTYFTAARTRTSAGVRPPRRAASSTCSRTRATERPSASPIIDCTGHCDDSLRSTWHHIRMISVEIYTTRTCGSCIRAKRLFDSKGIEYEEIDVSMDRSAMITRAGGRMTVPQIFIEDEGIGGFDELIALDRAGKLDPMLRID